MSSRNYAEVPHNRCHMPRARMTQRRILFKNLHVLRQLIWWCSGYRVCLPRTRCRSRGVGFEPGGNTCFHFHFFEEKGFVSRDRYSVFLSIICYKSFSFQKIQCTYRHPTNKKVEMMNKIFLRCIFDRNNFFSLIKCYCSVFFSWIILCIILLYK